MRRGGPRRCWAHEPDCPGGEAAAVSQVLNAAAWTYVAAFITSLVYFLWHLLPLLRRAGTGT